MANEDKSHTLLVHNKKRWRSESGAQFVEFSISVFIFLAALILTVEVVRLSLNSVTSQLIVGRAIRIINVREVHHTASREEDIFRNILNMTKSFGLPSQMLLCLNEANIDNCTQIDKVNHWVVFHKYQASVIQDSW